MVQLVNETSHAIDKHKSLHDETGGSVANDLRVIRVGLLGCGTVGTAVARQLTKINRQLAESGLRLQIVQALVRNTSKLRRDLPPDLQLTDNADAFLAESYDVVIEALGGLDTARSLIVRLLAAGTPVVTANKEVVAEYGAEFKRSARTGKTQIRFEAAAIPGVPFLETIARPAITGGVREIAGIVNGTTQFILNAVDKEGLTVDAALHRAIVLGLAEPDATRDLAGLDAAAKLRIILRQVGFETGRSIPPARIGVETITPQFAADARKLGGCIRQIVLAKIEDDDAAAYVGPAWIGNGHVLSRLASLENCVAFRDATGGRTQFAGIGAGPDVTARALIDDVIAITTTPRAQDVPLTTRPTRNVEIRANIRTSWFVDAALRNDSTRPARLGELLSSFGVWFRRFESATPYGGVARAFGMTYPQDQTTIDKAIRTIQAETGAQVLALPAVEDDSHG